MEIFKIGNDIWEIKEIDIDGEERFLVRKNGIPYQCCAGDIYETSSGASGAILNEYRIS